MPPREEQRPWADGGGDRSRHSRRITGNRHIGAAPLKSDEPPAKKRLNRQEGKDAAEEDESKGKEHITGEPVVSHYVQRHHHALVEMAPRVFAHLFGGTTQGG